MAPRRCAIRWVKCKLWNISSKLRLGARIVKRACGRPDGWLSLTGLFILYDGQFRLGSEEGNDIVLPSSAPATLGIVDFVQGKASLTVTSDTPVLANGVPVEFVELVDNRSGQRPTLVTVGSVSFFVHKFGDEYALRVKDSNNPAIQAFGGCIWYEVRPEYCVCGKFMRQPEATAITVDTVAKTTIEYMSIGTVDFELLGKPLQLLATATSKPNELFIILRDATAGRESYGAGRYLYAEVDSAGNVTLDFNKAYNPPCAFTPYATCTLPPRQNILTVPVEAGEKY